MGAQLSTFILILDVIYFAFLRRNCVRFGRVRISTLPATYSLLLELLVSNAKHELSGWQIRKTKTKKKDRKTRCNGTLCSYLTPSKDLVDEKATPKRSRKIEKLDTTGRCCSYLTPSKDLVDEQN